MKNNKITYCIAGLIIGVAIMWVLSSIVFQPNRTGMMGRTNDQNVVQNSDVMDAHFIEQMIPHHEDAITMAKLAQTRAQTPEVKQLAANIIESQGKEITQMKAWYKEWYGREFPTGSQVTMHHGMGSSSSMHMGMMGDENDMKRLENAENFDQEFVEEMIPHHQMAVMMASMLQNGTTRPEMKKLADDIIVAQTDEINQMRTWLKKWENSY